MQTSESISDISAALAKAQGSMGGALKDSSNPFFKSKYADLESVWQACRKSLSENALAVIQTVSWAESRAVVTTMLTHASGQWIRDTLSMQPKDDSPQGIGSCITYARRYGLAAIVGVYQTDDDGEAAHGRSQGGEAIMDQAKKAQEYAKRFKESFELGLEGAVLDLCDELKGHGELHAAVWGYLPTGMRKQIKDLLEREKKGFASPNGTDAGARG